MKRLLYIFLCLLIISHAYSTGVAVVDARNGIYFRLDSTLVSVSVEGQIATTTTLQYFTNTSAPNSVKYAFPLSEQVSATTLRWKAEGQWYAASIAGTKQDTTLPGGNGSVLPSLAMYLGKTPLYFSIPQTIQKDSTLAIELTYVELLPYISGNVRYSYPSDYHLIQPNAIALQELTFHLTSQRLIDSIKVLSTHPISSLTNTGTVADIVIRQQELQINQNYAIQYTLNTTQLGLFGYSSFFSSSQVPDTLGNGFLAFIAEPNPNDQAGTIKKVFTLIIDRSGSMSGSKMIQARDAASFIVNHLNEGDRFNLIDFDDIISSFRPYHVLYSQATRDSALAYITTLTARGLTSISGAFAKAVPQFTSVSDSTANIIIFFTDGQPTTGITDMQLLISYVDNLIASSERKIFLFCFGIGTDANQQLLSLMSNHNRGAAEFLGNDELYSRITNFYLTIRYPVLLDSRIDFSPPIVSKVYPDSLPNLYKGNQMVVTGRYRQPGPVSINLTGTAFGKPVKYTYSVMLLDSVKPSNQFLPKIWAKRKIESLLLRYYLLSPTSVNAVALKNEIIATSRAYGVLSQFTSFTGGATGVENTKLSEYTMPHDFELSGNFPNPFNPSTTIQLQVLNDIAGIMTIRIYNIAGQLVRTLTLSIHGRKMYTITWDGATDAGIPLPSGVYFYGVELHNTVLVGKMNLLK